MDDSTYEMFEEELGKPLRDVSAAKSLLQTRRPESHTQRRTREEPPIVQQIPKAEPREALPSRVSLRKALSIQNLAQIQVPWEGVTLNRCLLVAITIVVITSGFQRLHDVVRGQRNGADVEPARTAVYTRHATLRRGRLAPPQLKPETSLWETFFWWVADDDDDDDEEEERRRVKSRKVIRERASRGLRPPKPILGRKAQKQREERFKVHRGKMREDKESPARVTGQRENDKRPKRKIPEEVQEEEATPKKVTRETKMEAIQNQ
ncbi:uncharacterized protein LOC143493139 [Brachyhypopomus gauderio]|uniref:uncharacterized protein LOC143493139 n=1 Tax=Brachyhypopomus gauderio TaxID=698409 RepID=UPI0040426696